MSERQTVEKTIRPDGSNERLEICLGGVVHVLSLKKGEEIARTTLALLGIDVAQLEEELRIEKQKHRDTSNLALEQQDRADRLEAKLGGEQ